ncbi:MAG TPA: MtnX-like HAD-IB family phosphatase [Hyphomicrobiaceae bacterium]|nr:MtnX-like HAD-IB family phosphatase [Hyphomicrobiaceae bacterium]
MSRPRVKCHVFVDFDGTIASLDTTDSLLERFAAPEWRLIEDDWKAGLIGSRECLVRQIDLVRATPGELDDFIETIEIDPGFASFVDLCIDAGHDVTVVSDGLDRTVEAVLKRHDLDLAFYANHLEWRGEDRWRLRFPHARSACEALSGNCKCQFTDKARLDLRMVIGDGRSDFCIARRADLVLAKSALLPHCVATGLPVRAFDNFETAAIILAGWLDGHDASMPAASLQRADD